MRKLASRILLITIFTAYLSTAWSNNKPHENNPKKVVLVFSGGGVAGTIAYGGVIKALELAGNEGKDQFKLKNIKAVASSSAGSLAAAAIGLGYTSEEISNILFNIDFSKFTDSHSTAESAAFLPIFYGLYRGNAMLEYLRELVKMKSADGNPDASLQQIKNENNIAMYLSVVNLAQQEAIFFSSEEDQSKDIPIATSVRTSISVPFVYDAMFFNKIYNGSEYTWQVAKTNNETTSAFVDGGTLRNFPLEKMQKLYPDDNVLGVLLQNQDGIDWFEKGERNFTPVKAGDPVAYFTNMLATVRIPEYTKYFEHQDTLLKNTIRVNMGDVVRFDFNLPEKVRKTLFKDACVTVLEYIFKNDSPVSQSLDDLKQQCDFKQSDKFDKINKSLEHAANVGAAKTKAMP